VRVPERAHGDAGAQIQIPLAGKIPELAAATA
jgi:hypothetical protein